jgi:hypothetical protein
MTTTPEQRALTAEAKLTDLAHELHMAHRDRDAKDGIISIWRLFAITGWIAAASLAVVLVFVLGGK